MGARVSLVRTAVFKTVERVGDDPLVGSIPIRSRIPDFSVVAELIRPLLHKTSNSNDLFIHKIRT